MANMVQSRGKIVTNIVSTVWGFADILRSHFRPGEYGRVILPLLIARRMDLILADTLVSTLQEIEVLRGIDLTSEVIARTDGLYDITGCGYFRMNDISLETIAHNPLNARELFAQYLDGYSESVRDIFDGFRLRETVERLLKGDLLLPLLNKVISLDLHSDVVSNPMMGDLFEHLIRKFSEVANETAGEHFTPRDAVDLVISLVVQGSDPALRGEDLSPRKIYDPTAGTGGFLSVAYDKFESLVRDAQIAHGVDLDSCCVNALELCGQELNPESYAICKSDMLSKGKGVSNIKLGDTLVNDQFPNDKFHYMISNPPYGVDWKKCERLVKDEYALGNEGRFAPGLPRSSDGQFLFLLHLMSKFPDVRAHNFGGRIGIVLNSAPMASGNAGSGESEIRRYILENDLLESVVSLPNDMFYNTGIGTYIWILTNSKAAAHRGKVVLLDASSLGTEMAVALGSKRRLITDENRQIILDVYNDVRDWDIACMDNGSYVPYPVDVARPLGAVSSVPLVRVVNTYDFLYRELIVERPKYDEYGAIMRQTKGKNKGQVIADADMRSVERISFRRDPAEFMATEVTPFLPDAFLDMSKERVGAEISWGEHFFVPEVLPTVAELDAEIRALRDLIFVEGI